MIGCFDNTATVTSVTSAWPPDWERSEIVNLCRHEIFEAVMVTTPTMTPDERVVRCYECHAPRCGHSDDSNPCMRIRHHLDAKPNAGREPHLFYFDLYPMPDLADQLAVEKWLDA